MDVPAGTSGVSLQGHDGKVNFCDIRQVYPDRTLAFVGFRRHENAALATEGLNGSNLEFMVLCPQWTIPHKAHKNGRDNGKRRARKKKAV